ncbi:MAG: isocitrate/isopropylmalate dehydrogenase family protein [Myxococcota bacterium]
MTKRIAVLGGDGIGPEVISVGLEVLRLVAEQRAIPLELIELDLGAERYLRDGTTFPEEIAAEIQTCDGILLGALGDPRVPDMRHARDILFGLRFGLDLYCNIRPVHCLDDSLMPLRGRAASDCDLVVFRENTEGIYVGVGGQFKRGTPDEIAISEDINTRKGVERILRAAFTYARDDRGRRLHMVDKHNAMQHAHELWLRVFHEVRLDYPEVEAEHLFVDAMCFHLVQDPSQFDVVVTCNLFGDILTDLGAALQGGLGMAASANIRPGGIAMCEPVHGSAPPLANQDVANPFATVLAVGMLLAHLGYPEEELRLQQAIRHAVQSGECTRDVGGSFGLRQTGSALCRRLRDHPPPDRPA